MTTADRLLSEFIDAWRAGQRPDAGEYVDRAPPDERAELADHIETFMALAPEPEYDESTWAALTADPAVARIAAAVQADAVEAWSTLLPRLRQRHGLTLDGLATAVAERLGLTAHQAKTRAYLDDLEHDRLVPERLSRRLLDTLAGLLGAPAAWLERAGAGPAAPAGALYRRQGQGTIEQHLEVIADAMLTPADEWDDVDELFQGGR
jgi:transcriptional regulator with XRE-family HTH domain